MMEKLFPDPFLNTRNWAYIWINSLRFYAVCFYCIPSWGISKYIKIKLQATCFYLIWSFFKKQREFWNYSPCLIFWMIFEEKIFFLLYSITWSFTVWLPLLREILRNMSFVIVMFVIQIKPFFTQPIRQNKKINYLENEKSFH